METTPVLDHTVQNNDQNTTTGPNVTQAPQPRGHRAYPASTEPVKKGPRTPAPPKSKRGNDFSLANQPTTIMNNAGLSADGYWIVRRMMSGEYVTQENSGVSAPEWQNLMKQLGRDLQPG